MLWTDYVQLLCRGNWQVLIGYLNWQFTQHLTVVNIMACLMGHHLDVENSGEYMVGKWEGGLYADSIVLYTIYMKYFLTKLRTGRLYLPNHPSTSTPNTFSQSSEQGDVREIRPPKSPSNSSHTCLLWP